MTPDEFKAQLQNAQDMLRAVENQRNSANNECVQLAAQIMSLQRKVEELQKTASVADEVDPVPAPKSNGTEAQPALQ